LCKLSKIDYATNRGRIAFQTTYLLTITQAIRALYTVAIYINTRKNEKM